MRQIEATLMAPMSSPATGHATTSGEDLAARPALEDLLGVGITVARGAGQTVVVEGDPRTQGFRVLSGAVRLYKAMPDGRRQVIDFLGVGECFGLVGLTHHTCSVEAIVPSTLACYPLAGLDALMRSKPELAFRLLEAAGGDLHQAHGHMLLLGRKSADEKVASLLLVWARRSGSRGRDGVAFRLPMTRQDMADYLGLTIETVSRTLTRLRQDGLIRFASVHDVIVVGRADLEALAYGSG